MNWVQHPDGISDYSSYDATGLRIRREDDTKKLYMV